MPGPIVALARRFMSNPIHMRANDPDEGLTQANIKHLVYRAHSLDKDEVIARILQPRVVEDRHLHAHEARGQKLVDELNDRGSTPPPSTRHEPGVARALHGGLQGRQARRPDRDRRRRARIDVNDVTHVINHTIPDDEKTYLHRAAAPAAPARPVSR